MGVQELGSGEWRVASSELGTCKGGGEGKAERGSRNAESGAEGGRRGHRRMVSLKWRRLIGGRGLESGLGGAGGAVDVELVADLGGQAAEERFVRVADCGRDGCEGG